MARAADGTISLAITGHRLSHPGLRGRAEAVEGALRTLFDLLAASPISARGVALSTMLADGADQIATRCALALGWQVNAILPFGAALTCAIGATSNDDGANTKRAALEEAQRVMAFPDQSENAAIQTFAELSRLVRIEPLLDDEAHYAASWIDGAPSFSAEASQRYALAARRALERSDFVVAVWNGASTDSIGGTGHTIIEALKLQLPVIWLEPAAPETLRWLTSEADLAPPPATIHEAVARLTEHLSR